MRKWTSVANWVLSSAGSSTNGIACLSVFCRRFSNSEAVKKNNDDMKEKSLYLCFNEFHHDDSNIERLYVNQIVRPIRLTRFGDGEDEEEEYLEEEASREFLSRNINTGRHCTTFGSKIVFPHGPHTRQVHYIDYSTRPIQFSDMYIVSQSPSVEEDPKIVRLGEIDRKLYRFDNYMNQYSDLDSNCFEVYDPRVMNKWQPLDGHPFLLFPRYNVAYLEASKKILGWGLDEDGVFCFDTSKPENGWTEVPPSLGEVLPYLNSANTFYNSPLFIHNYHHDIGDFHLHFYYDPIDDPTFLSVYYLSNNFDSFQAINKPVRLPILCREYFHIFELEAQLFRTTCERVTCDYEFVLLGPQKVGLLLHKFFGNEYAEYKGKILMVIFEYQIFNTPNSNSTVEIQTRLLGTRRFAYHVNPMRIRNQSSPVTYMNGAFWL